MTIFNLNPDELRLTIQSDALGFADTAELLQHPLPWIGQERAERAAWFGLSMEQPDYNLFVLGEVGSGRSSLLKQAMKRAAESKKPSSDLCYVHNFDAPERPCALSLPAGQGRVLRQAMVAFGKVVQSEISQRMNGPDFKVEAERIEKNYKREEAAAYAVLDAYAEARHFTLHRESGHLVFTLMGAKKHALTENEMLALSKERRAEIDVAEQEVRVEITSFLGKTRPMERQKVDALVVLKRQTVKPLLDAQLQKIRDLLSTQSTKTPKLSDYLESVAKDVLDNVELFVANDDDDEGQREGLGRVLSRYRVNLVVDNDGVQGAPVIIEDNPLFRSLFGSIEYHSENEVLVTDFCRIRAGSLLKAHGGYLMLHLRDLLVDGLVWEKLRRFLRNGALQIEEPGTAFAPIAAVSLEPEAVEVDVKIILIGSREQYYELQEQDPEFSRHFRVKVDFAESFLSNDATRRSFAIFVAHTCQDLGLLHFSPAAVARLLEQTHRDVEDQSRQSAIFARSEALVMESAALCHERAGLLVDAVDVDAALAAYTLRHDYPAQCLQESIAEGEMLIAVHGEKIGQVNGLTVVETGDFCFGYPVRLTARTFAGNDGLLNIEREVEMSGPIHDKGVLILHNYLSALFGHIAPLALSASIVFEQEYHGVEGDSASCAELYALLSSLSGLPLKQGVAVTGAVNQHGEVLPVGGINEKIEGYFRICERMGLNGSQGVLIPSRNRRHLMLNQQVVKAVEQGLFHIHAVDHVCEGMLLLLGQRAGEADGEGAYPHGSVLGRAQRTLQSYRRACLASEHPKAGRKQLR